MLTRSRSIRIAPTTFGYTLLELVVASASAAVLVAGLSGTLFIAAQAIQVEDDPSRHARIAGEILTDMMLDVRDARTFSERTANAITFTVPDRTGDNLADTIRYAWSGTIGEPLTFQMNGGPVVDLATDVQHFNLRALTRVISPPAESEEERTVTVVFEEVTSPKEGGSFDSSLILDAPSGTAEQDLLIAVVVIDGDSGSMYPPSVSGWVSIPIAPSNKISLGLWYKLAAESEPSTYEFSWEDRNRSLGWIMRFSGHDTSDPIVLGGVAPEEPMESDMPLSPEVITTKDNSMILRIGGFDDDEATTGDAGVADNTIFCENGSSCAGAAGYANLAEAGPSGTSNFQLEDEVDFLTVTIAIAPEVAE